MTGLMLGPLNGFPDVWLLLCCCDRIPFHRCPTQCFNQLEDSQTPCTLRVEGTNLANPCNEGANPQEWHRPLQSRSTALTRFFLQMWRRVRSITCPGSMAMPPASPPPRSSTVFVDCESISLQRSGLAWTVGLCGHETSGMLPVAD